VNFVSRFLYRTKERIEALAAKPHAAVWLFCLAAAEASLIPLAPDFLFVPLSVARPRRSLYYAGVCVAGSVCGAFVGYYVGFALFHSVGTFIIEAFGWKEVFLSVLERYKENALSVLSLAGFTPLPFQVFTIGAGFAGISLGRFTVGTTIGRALRFFVVGSLLWFVGPTLKTYVDRSLTRATIIAFLLIAVWILVTKTLV
jgi:membrane protein YqaA with SNARE-associated domain